jgi:hypothetical protein
MDINIVLVIVPDQNLLKSMNTKITYSSGQRMKADVSVLFMSSRAVYGGA